RMPARDVPPGTALAAVVAHLQNTATPDFQPANVTWAFFPPPSGNVRDKRERRRAMAARALESIGTWEREEPLGENEDVGLPARIAG
ncbi:MAG TPA: hypothetical protein VKG44_00325, partial [Candidatus Baltobacteraceae bacterium]|nr:hypothetical protein [Candidatus Baltobacteraceae bacterium]